MSAKITLILLIGLTQSLYAQNKLESDLIVAIALKSTSPTDTLVHKASLQSLYSIEKLSSSRKFRKVKKLEGLRNFIIVLEQVKLTDQSCLNSTYNPLKFEPVLPSDSVSLHPLEINTTKNLSNGKSKAATAQARIEEKNSKFQNNQIKLLENQQKILNDTRVKSDTLLRQLIKDQRNALEAEHRQRWLDEKVQCKIKINESIHRLQTEVMRLKGVFARAYRRHLKKQNETV